MSSGDLENVIYTCIDRYFRGQLGGQPSRERHGLVTSWDPDKHLAKVMFQPEQQESDWLPVEREHIGNNFGIAVGLTPGDGKQTGDQVIVRYHAGDVESAKIAKVVHSDQDKPPRVESGEMVMWARFTKTAKPQSGLGDDTTDQGSGDQVGEQGGQQGSGAQIFFKKDGSLTITDGAGASHVMDGKGNVTHTSNNKTDNFNGNHTTTVTGDRSRTVKGKDTISIGKDKNVTISGKRSDSVSKTWSTSAMSTVWSWLTSGSDASD
jgi:hypothetical protein